MLHWEIDGRKCWLCRECTRMNTAIFLRADTRLLAESHDPGRLCSCCSRSQREVAAGEPPPPQPAAPQNQRAIPALLPQFGSWLTGLGRLLGGDQSNQAAALRSGRTK